ncbi:class I SAM-dependent methyltransferase [Patescibacteria group bacterium]|nr:class I SAM-dependent methyltransferase [Patescibacteria group bacterium]
MLKNPSPHYWRFKRYQELLGGLIKKTDRVLDVGCGEGHLLFLLSEANKYGVDIEKTYLARAKAKNLQARFKPASAEDLPFKNSFFDLVCCTEVIEHINRPKQCLREVQRVLKPGGYCLFSTYNHFNIFNILTLKAFSSEPRITPGHMREYSWISFKKLVQNYFEIIKITQAGSSQLVDGFFQVVKLPLADFMIVLAVK